MTGAPVAAPEDDGGGNPHMEAYEGFWAGLVAPQGELELDLVARELHDYLVLLRAATESYGLATEGAVTDPRTAPSVVAEAVNRRVDRAFDDGAEQALWDVAKALREGGPERVKALVDAALERIAGG